MDRKIKNFTSFLIYNKYVLQYLKLTPTNEQIFILEYMASVQLITLINRTIINYLYFSRLKSLMKQ